MGEVIPWPLRKRNDGGDHESLYRPIDLHPEGASSISSEDQSSDPSTPVVQETPSLGIVLQALAVALQQNDLGIQFAHLFWSPVTGLIVSASPGTPSEGPEPHSSEDPSVPTDEELEEAYKTAVFETLQDS
jgi:hypothetical protein